MSISNGGPGRRVVFVLGMHRGGTSALAKGVAGLGVALGERLMPAVPDQNAAGFWEDLDVVALNDRVLLALGRTWDSLEPIAPQEWHQPELDRLADEGLALLLQRLDREPFWAVKDPRAARLLPFWQPLLARAGADVTYVIALRNPLSVARSLAVRNGFAAEKSHLLWLGHMLAAMCDTADAKRLVVDYDRLMRSPSQELERVARILAVPLDDALRGSIAAYANNFLSFDLRHSAFEPGAVRSDPRVPGLVSEAFELLQGLAEDHAGQIPVARSRAWLPLEQGFRAFAPTLRYLDALEQGRREESPAPAIMPAAAARAEASPPGGQTTPSDAVAQARVSVVIPLYNHSGFIEQAIASIFAQTLPPVEVIVVDDGSTDDSADVMRSLCVRHPGIVFWSEPNQGAHHALNAAIHRASGEFISILNSDDIYDPRRLETCLTAMIADPAVDAVATRVQFIDADSAPLQNAWYEKALDFLAESGDLPLALANANLLVSTSNCFVRRAVFEELGYFSPLRYTHDLDFALRLLASGRKLHIVEEPLLRYRVHARNTIAEDAPRVDVERAAVLALYLHRLWQSTGDRAILQDHMVRMIALLESEALGDFVESFVGMLDGPPRSGVAGALLIALQAARPATAAIRVDWLARGEQQSLLSNMISARQALLGAKRSTPPFWLRAFESLEESNAWLQDQNHSLTETLKHRESLVEEQASWIAKLEEARAWHEEQIHGLQASLTGRDALVAEQAAWMTQLEEARAWHAEQIRSLQASLTERDALVAEQAAWMTQLEGARAWHAEQIRSLQASLTERDALVAEQAAWMTQLEGARAWDAEQIHGLQASLTERDALVEEQAAWMDNVAQSRSWRLMRALNLTPRPRRHDHQN